MPEVLNDRKVFSLCEVSGSIRRTLADRYTSSFWVQAEMNKLNLYRQSGHCYPELVEKRDGKIIAQMKAHLWKQDFERINTRFLRTLNEPLKDGIKILFEARITFDEVHGLSLWITDMDPAYTLGDLEKEKQETIRRLRTEGIFDRNKSLKLPLLPQRIAIVSVETSKGYADFLQVLENNPWGYGFFHFLFPSLLQGDRAAEQIVAQLARIRRVLHHFDLVAIIRGGGGDVGLSCYNTYELAREIALFPIPVMTGIGHATNETVAEMVSFSNAITPTKLAEYLIQKFHNFSVPVKDAERAIADRSVRLLREERERFQSSVKLFRSVSQHVLLRHRNEMRSASTSLQHHARFVCRSRRDALLALKAGMIRGAAAFRGRAGQELVNCAVAIRKDSQAQLNHAAFLVSQLGERLRAQGTRHIRNSRVELDHLEKHVSNMSPANVLKRGYSITLLNGRALTRATEAKAGDTLATTLFEGSITSTVNGTNTQSDT